MTQRLEPSAAFVAALDAALPRAEFSVAMLGQAKVILELEDAAGTVVGGAIGIEGANTLSGAPVLVALLADDEQLRTQLEAPLLPLVVGGGSLELLGPGGVAAQLARSLAARVGGSASAVMEQRLMAAGPGDIQVPWEVAGWARRMTALDHRLVAGWLDAFAVEALGSEARGVDAWLPQVTEVGSSMWLWTRDDEPLAMAMGRSTTASSSRIGPVFTPPAHRRHGYASALTAHLARGLLTRGDKRVVLLTDVTNPTSNNVYRRIGFTDVDRHASWVVRAPVRLP